jgi:pantetheine-phosphate adenylyltransferase
MTTAIYAGSFDPFTKGHEYILKKALCIFDKIIIAVGDNPNKKCLFSVDERVDIIRKSLPLKYSAFSLDGVEITSFNGLLVIFMAVENIFFSVRGIRNIKDFEYEFEMSKINHKLDNNITTIFLPTSDEYSLISSSSVKKKYASGNFTKNDVSDYTHEMLIQKLKKKEKLSK